MKHTIELDDLELTALITHLEGQNEMMVHKRQFLDKATYDYQLEYWRNKIFQANQHLKGED